jgi:hypothetical protein
MPPTERTKIVLWYQDRHNAEEAWPAIVTFVGERTIDLAIIFPDYTTFVVKTGVHHISDPDGEIIDRLKNGVWDYGTDDIRLGEMAAAITSLTSRIERLERKSQG